MWTVDGAVILWVGYWLFMAWVVWTYERKVRDQKMEIEKLKRVLERRIKGTGNDGYFHDSKGEKLGGKTLYNVEKGRAFK